MAAPIHYCPLFASGGPVDVVVLSISRYVADSRTASILGTTVVGKQASALTVLAGAANHQTHNMYDLFVFVPPTSSDAKANEGDTRFQFGWAGWMVLHPSLNSLVASSVVSDRKWLCVSKVNGLVLDSGGRSALVITGVIQPVCAPRHLQESQVMLFEACRQLDEQANQPLVARGSAPLLGSRRLGVTLDCDDDLPGVPRFLDHAAYVTRGLGAGLVQGGVGVRSLEARLSPAVLDAADAAGEAVLTEAVGVRLDTEQMAAARQSMMALGNALGTLAAASAAHRSMQGAAPLEQGIQPSPAHLQAAASHLRAGLHPRELLDIAGLQLRQAADTLVGLASVACLRHSPPQLGRHGPWGLKIVFTGRRFRHGLPTAWTEQSAEQAAAASAAADGLPAPATATVTARGGKEDVDDGEKGGASAATSAASATQAQVEAPHATPSSSESGLAASIADTAAGKRPREGEAPAPPVADEVEVWEEEVEPVAAVLHRAMARVRRRTGDVPPLLVGRLVKVNRPHSFASPGQDMAWPLVLTFELADSTGAVAVSCWNAAAAGAWAILRDAPLGSLVAVRVHRLKNASDSRLHAHARIAAGGLLELSDPPQSSSSHATATVGATMPEVAINSWPAPGSKGADALGGGSRAIPVLRVREATGQTGDGRWGLLVRTRVPAALQAAGAEAVLAQACALVQQAYAETKAAMPLSAEADVTRVACVSVRNMLAADELQHMQEARRLAGVPPHPGEPHWAEAALMAAGDMLLGAPDACNTALGGALVRKRFPRIRLGVLTTDAALRAAHGQTVSVAGIITHVGTPFVNGAADAAALKVLAASAPDTLSDAQEPSPSVDDEEEEEEEEEEASSSSAHVGRRKPHVAGSKAKPAKQAAHAAGPALWDRLDTQGLRRRLPRLGRKAAGRVLAMVADGRLEALDPALGLAMQSSRAASSPSSSPSSSSDALDAAGGILHPIVLPDGRLQRRQWIRVRSAGGRDVAILLSTPGRWSGEGLRVGAAVLVTHVQVLKPAPTDAADEAERPHLAAAALSASLDAMGGGAGVGNADIAAFLAAGDRAALLEEEERFAAVDATCAVLVGGPATDVVLEEALRRPVGAGRRHPGVHGWLGPPPSRLLQGGDALEGMEADVLEEDDETAGATEYAQQLLEGRASTPTTVLEHATARTVHLCRHQGLLGPAAHPEAPALHEPRFEQWRRDWGPGLAGDDWDVAAGQAVQADAVRGLVVALEELEDADHEEAEQLDGNGHIRGGRAREAPKWDEAEASNNAANGRSKSKTRPRRASQKTKRSKSGPKADGAEDDRPWLWGIEGLSMPHLSVPALPEAATGHTMSGARIQLPRSAADEAALHAAVARCRRYVRDAVVATLQEAVMHHARAGEAARGEQERDAAREDVDVDEEQRTEGATAAAGTSQARAASSSSSPVEAAKEEDGAVADAEKDAEDDAVAAARMAAAAEFALFRLRTISASAAYHVYAVAARACLNLVQVPLAANRRHPRVQGWAVLSGAVPPPPPQTTTGLPPMLPPLSAVPRLSVAAAMRVAECLRDGQVVRAVVSARPVEFVRSAAVTAALLASSTAVLRQELGHLRLPPSKDLSEQQVVPDVLLALQQRGLWNGKVPGADEGNEQEARGQEAPSRRAKDEVRAKRIKQAEPSDVGVTATPFSPPATRSSSRGRGLAVASTNTGSARSRRAAAKVGPVASGVAESAPSAGTAFLDQVGSVLEGWMPWISVREPFVTTRVWPPVASAIASHLGSADPFSRGVVSRQFERLVCTYASLLTGGEIFGLAALRKATRIATLDPRIAAALKRDGFAPKASAFPRLGASRQGIMDMQLMLASVVWACGFRTWEDGLRGKRAWPSVFASPKAQFRKALARAVAATTKAGGLDQMAKAASSARPAAADAPAAAAASSKGQASGRSRGRVKVLEVPEEVAAPAPAPAPAAATKTAGTATELRLAAEAACAELEELAQMDDELLRVPVPISETDLGADKEAAEWSSAAQAWSLVVGPYEDAEAMALADASAASSGLQPLKRKGKGAAAVLTKAAKEQAQREAVVAGLTASGRLLEILLPRDEDDAMFGSQLTDTLRNKTLACEGLPHVVRAVTALSRADAAGAHGWSHARAVQQWLSKSEHRMLLCVSIRATSGLRPAVISLEGIFQEFAGPVPPL